jgi:trk system potassium uptake protein TrkA
VEETQSFVPLLIVVALAFVVPVILTRFKRLRLPVVVGEILAGIIIGDSGLGLVGHEPMLEMLALLGFAFLMFLSGLEVDFDAILPRPGVWLGSWKERMSNPLALGIVAFALTVGLAVVGGFGLQGLDAADDPWLAALILSTTSLGLVMPVLKERGLTAGPYGQALLVTAVIADFVTMLLVSVYAVVRIEGLSPQVLLVLLLFGAFGTAYRLARVAFRRFPGVALDQWITGGTAQMDVRGAFLVGLAFIALAQGLGAEMILGAFLGGALISLLSERGGSDLHHKLDMFGYSFFIPIFFIMVGVRFDFAALLGSRQTLLLVPLLLVLAYGIKLIAALVFRIRFSWRETLAGGTLLSARLSLIIAISAIGLALGSIDAATNSAIILVAIVTSTVSPLLFNRIAPAVPTVCRRFVIVGAGRSARMLAGRIVRHGEDVVLVDSDRRHVAAAQEAGLPLVNADATNAATWLALEPETIRAVAVLLRDDERNLRICQVLRGKLGMERVVSRADDATQIQLLAQMGVQVINPILSPVVELEYLLLYPSVSSLLTDLEDEHDITEVRLASHDLAGRPLQELELPQGVMIVLVRRNGDVIHPQGNTVLRIGDRLTLMGGVEAVRELAQRCA